MTDTSVIEGNKLIAEWLGWEFVKDDNDPTLYKDHYLVKFEGQPMWQDNELAVNRVLEDGHAYHKDWNKLMPVVEKINALLVPEDSRGDVTYVVTIEPGYCVISAGGEGIVSEEQAFDSGEPLIATVYRAVTHFIERYNSQKEVHHG